MKETINQNDIILAARITAMPKSLFDPMPKVFVQVGTLGVESEQFLFEYYPDEISFTPEEFIGLTVEEAATLKFNKDKKYLQS